MAGCIWGNEMPLPLPKPRYRAQRKRRQQWIKRGRRKFYETVQALDNHECQCREPHHDHRYRISAHHIIYLSHEKNDDPSNGITLCQLCHYEVHNGCRVLKLTGRQFMIKILESLKDNDNFRWDRALGELKRKEGQ